MAYRKETHGSLILKWFRSQVEQVKQLEGKQKRAKEEEKNRSFLKANGLSAVILLYIKYCKTYLLHGWTVLLVCDYSLFKWNHWLEITKMSLQNQNLSCFQILMLQQIAHVWILLLSCLFYSISCNFTLHTHTFIYINMCVCV